MVGPLRHEALSESAAVDRMFVVHDSDITA
jgi:hypothetical protein